MASGFQIGKLALCPLLSGKPSLRTSSSSRLSIASRRFINIHCRLRDGDNEADDKEAPESLFMKELKRRGMTPTPPLEDDGKTSYEAVDDDVDAVKEKKDFSKRSAVSTDYEKSLTEQRARSMALNSEGLEGLVPRARLLLTIGGTFFIGFWPLIIVTVASFSALYLKRIHMLILWTETRSPQRISLILLRVLHFFLVGRGEYYPHKKDGLHLPWGAVGGPSTLLQPCGPGERNLLV